MRQPQLIGVELIAGFKVFKAVLLFTVTFGLLSLMHRDVATIFSMLLEELHLNAHSRLLHSLVLRIDALRPHDLLVASLVTMVYGAMCLTEGIGLWYERTWAGYLAVTSTALFLPFEIRELFDRVTLVRVGVLLMNLAIMAYLIVQIKHHHLHSRREKARRLAQEETSA